MKQQERIFLIAMTVGLSLMLVLRDVLGYGLSKYIYFIYAVLFMVIAKYETMVYMICFMLPLVCGLPGTYIMPVALVLLVLKKNKLNGWQVVMVLFVMVAEVFASLWYQTVQYSLIVQYVSFAGVVFFLIHDETELDNLMCVRMYMLGVILLCGTIITTAIMTAPTDWMDSFAEGEFRFGETQMEELEGMKLTLNANSLAYYSITAISCGVLLVERTKKWERLIFLLGIVLTATAGLLSVSRTWLLVVAIGVLLYILSKVKYPRRFIIAIIVVAVIIYSALWLLGESTDILKAFETRLNYENMDGAGGRTDVFQRYMELFWDNTRVMFLGSGVTQYSRVLGESKAIHNGLQQILICYGIFGFAVMLVALIKPVIRECAGRKMDMTCLLPIIGITLFVQSIQFLNPMMLMLPYVIGIYALKCTIKTDVIPQTASFAEMNRALKRGGRV